MQKTTKWLLVGGALGGVAWFTHVVMQRFFVVSFMAVPCRATSNCRGGSAWNYVPSFIDGFFTIEAADAYALRSTGSQQDLVITVNKKTGVAMGAFAKGKPLVPMAETFATLQSGGVTSFDLPTLKVLKARGTA